METQLQTEKKPRLAFPILKRQFDVGVKITVNPAITLPENFNAHWTEPNKLHGNMETHIWSPAVQNRDDFLSGEGPLIISFPLLEFLPERIWLHFRKRNPNLFMAAGRFRNSKDPKETEAFGLSIQAKKEEEEIRFEGEAYLNLGWYAKDLKEPGFEPLYLKTEIFDPNLGSKRTAYLRVNIENNPEKNILVLTVIEVPETEAPQHLQNEKRMTKQIKENPRLSRIREKLQTRGNK